MSWAGRRSRKQHHFFLLLFVSLWETLLLSERKEGRMLATSFTTSSPRRSQRTEFYFQLCFLQVNVYWQQQLLLRLLLLHPGCLKGLLCIFKRERQMDWAIHKLLLQLLTLQGAPENLAWPDLACSRARPDLASLSSRISLCSKKYGRQMRLRRRNDAFEGAQRARYGYWEEKLKLPKAAYSNGSKIASISQGHSLLLHSMLP